MKRNFHLALSMVYKAIDDGPASVTQQPQLCRNPSMLLMQNSRRSQQLRIEAQRSQEITGIVSQSRACCNSPAKSGSSGIYPT